MKNLYLIRGVSGSGKSTFAKMFANSLMCYYFEADMFFIDEKGDYNFDPSKIKDAHAWCKDLVEEQMSYRANDVVVSNTFTQEWEMKPYFDLAEKYGFRVTTLVVENRHGGENVHNVPSDVIEKQKKRFQIKL